MSTRYRLARPLAARVVGAALVTAALVVMVATVVAAGAGASLGALFAVAAAVVVVAIGVAAAVGSWSVLTLDNDGYRVRWRAAGVRAAAWTEVDDAAATYAGEEPVVLLQLRDGRRTVLPVRLLDVDREELVRALQEHLQRGHGIRRL